MSPLQYLPRISPIGISSHLPTRSPQLLSIRLAAPQTRLRSSNCTRPRRRGRCPPFRYLSRISPTVTSSTGIYTPRARVLPRPPPVPVHTPSCPQAEAARHVPPSCISRASPPSISPCTSCAYLPYLSTSRASLPPPPPSTSLYTPSCSHLLQHHPPHIHRGLRRPARRGGASSSRFWASSRTTG